ncbi:MAG: hypothetical protein ACI9KE_003836 [Polyangiales bacterium]|jgi:hypothetical protein
MTVFQAPFAFLLLLFCFAGCAESSAPTDFNLEIAGDAGVDAPDAPDAMEDDDTDNQPQGCGPE